MASQLANGEAQDATVPSSGCGETCAVSSEAEISQLFRGNKWWLEVERSEGSVTASRDRLARPEAVFRLKTEPKSRSGQNDRASIVAKKRVTTVEQRDAGEVET